MKKPFRKRSVPHTGKQTKPFENTPLFLKRDGGPGEGKNFFSRGKEVFPLPRNRRSLPGAGEKILLAAAEGIQLMDEGRCTLDDFLDFHAPAEFRRTVGHLLMTFCRRRGFIERELARLVPKAPDAKIRPLLLAAMTQTRFQSAVAPESAVSIAVELAKRKHADKFFNAVLRRYLRENVPFSEEPEIILPPAVFARWSKRFSPEELKRLTALFLSEPPFTFRVEKNAGELDFSSEFLCDVGPFTFRTGEAGKVLNSRALAEGRIYIQDPAAAHAPAAPDYSCVKTVLDLCAAPGGKSLMMSENLTDDGKLTAFDRSEARQELTKRNFACRHLPHRVLTGDPRTLKGAFDLVMADLPCSNTGVFRRRPDALWRFSEKDLREIRALQRELLNHAARLTAPGGQLVASTCSIEPEENAQLADEFLARHPGFRRVSQELILPSALTDGAGYACFRREG